MTLPAIIEAVAKLQIPCSVFSLAAEKGHELQSPQFVSQKF